MEIFHGYVTWPDGKMSLHDFTVHVGPNMLQVETSTKLHPKAEPLFWAKLVQVEIKHWQKGMSYDMICWWVKTFNCSNCSSIQVRCTGRDLHAVEAAFRRRGLWCQVVWLRGKKARGSFGFGPKSDAPATMHRRRRSVAQMAHSARRRSCHVRLFFGSNTSWVHCLAKASQAGFLQEHLLVRGSHEPACKVGKPWRNAHCSWGTAPCRAAWSWQPNNAVSHVTSPVCLIFSRTGEWLLWCCLAPTLCVAASCFNWDCFNAVAAEHPRRTAGVLFFRLRSFGACRPWSPFGW